MPCGSHWQNPTAKCNGVVRKVRYVLVRSGNLGRTLTRAEQWMYHVGRKPRPVLVLKGSVVMDIRELVTVAGATTSIRGLATKVDSITSKSVWTVRRH